jgi:predicted nucleotidyltransferase
MEPKLKDRLLGQVNKLCASHDATLVWAVLFGSHLYGTDTEHSDLDVKGLFIPSKDSVLLHEASNHISYSSGNDRSKNSSDDVDIELHSLQSWLSKLKKGDTHALDILFSFTHKDCVIYSDCPMASISTHVNKLLNVPALYDAVHGYAFGQAKKYGIKGSRMGVIKEVIETAKCLMYGLPTEEERYHTKLREFIDVIVQKHGDKSYCFQKEINGIKSLVLLGKMHQEGIALREFYVRIKSQYAEYGERARLAEENKGVDWKACSHAFRAIEEMRELLETGKIDFPLQNADMLRKIKLGELPWATVEQMILEKIDALATALQNSAAKNDMHFDIGFAHEIVLSCYK